MENIITQFWNRNKIILKSFWIGLLILLLLIPTSLIRGLVSERQQRHQEAVSGINGGWAGSQRITGPVIGIPYMETVSGDGVSKEQRRWAYLLPARLNIKARLVPERRYRGIYQVIVYTTELQVDCQYDSLHLAELNLPEGRMLWSEAAVFFDLSDPQGLKDEVTLHLYATPALSADLDMVTGKFPTDQFKNALSATLPAWLTTAKEGLLNFSATIQLKGSDNLSFIPTARETRVQATSPWPDPSFTGATLPDLRTIKDSGFEANWRFLSLNRKFPQQWKDNTFDLGESAFGVSLIVPVDTYQQTTRCVKYAILIILLTFTAFFLIEWIYQRLIHSLQYVLVGFALCLFYTLLLSFSEYIGFNAAYGIAAVATIGLITWYVGSMLRSGKMSLFICFLLVAQYGFVFTLIQLQDYALLLGSIGLFITLALVMYFSGKIRWNG